MVHIEDLPLQEFVAAVGELNKLPATEKLDGSALMMGRDSQGIYTARDDSRRFYSEKDYPVIAPYNGFRSAMDAITKVSDVLEGILEDGDVLTMEILYGDQPNAIQYGRDDKSYLILLSGKVNEVYGALKGRDIPVRVKNLTTSDGITLEETQVDTVWEFSHPQAVDMSGVPMAKLTQLTEKLDGFLSQESPIPDMSNGDILSRPLTKVPKEQRPAVKLARDEITTVVNQEYRIPVKRILNEFVDNLPGNFGKDDGTDNSMEGVVVKRGDQLIKIVDKDEFTTINIFNHSMRNSLSGVVKSTEPDASLESRGGILGNLKILQADLLGNKDFARGSFIRKALEALPGETPEAKMAALAGDLEVSDYLGKRRKITALTEQAKVDVMTQLELYQTNWETYILQLKNGKTMRISEIVHNRTLLAFAETFRQLDTMLRNIHRCDDLVQLLTLFYGRYTKATQVDERVITIPSDSLLLEKRLDTDKAMFKGKDAYTLMNMYFDTLLLAITIHQANDKRGIFLLKDKTHHRMTGLHSDMSPLNFWGYIVWRSNTDKVKKLIGPKTAAQLARIVKRIPPSYSRYLHLDLSYGKEMPIEWVDHLKTIKLLQQFEGMNTNRINKMVYGAFNYPTLDLDQRVEFLNRLYYYTTQFNGTSPLLLRLKIIQQNVLLNANGVKSMIGETKAPRGILMQLENEDFAGQAVGSPTNQQNDEAVKGGEVAAHRKTEKRKRNPAVHKNKFSPEAK